MIGYLDCYSGVSGDMLLGAILDAGLPLAELSAAIGGLSLDGFERLEATKVSRGAIQATKVDVIASRRQHHRPLGAILELLERADLDPPVRETSAAVLRRIAEVEGGIHGLPTEAVELHEVGAVDSIVDVVGTVAGLRLLGVDRLYASALPMSPGEITGRHHGALPAPAPAALALAAAARAPIRPFGDGRELVTPTGAALATMLATFDQPVMAVERVGYGAGGAELPWPNVLRLWLGQPASPEAETPAAPRAGDRDRRGGHVVLETNIDDMSPQLLAPAVESLFAAGALDVTLSPLSMKKGRQGTLVSVVAPADLEDGLARVLLLETTTLGVRAHDVRRHEADRAFESVDTPYGRIVVKLKLMDGRVVGTMPEFESVRAAAQAGGMSIAAVHAAAATAARRFLADAPAPGDRDPDE
ncbi:MAG TPA: nickel pincer cofactor biosynthesis protein LarC [Candidatus Limnocylindrales bacterium]